MCGVIGYWSPAPLEEHYHRLNELVIRSKIRGLHAFGYAYAQPSTDRPGSSQVAELVVRKALSLEQLAFLALTRVSPLPDRLIFHNRYSTSGDWTDENNNQPILSGTAAGTAALVFNGVISMGTKSEMEAELGEPMATENDGEMILLRFLRGEDIAAHLGSRGSFAGLIMAGAELYVLRNARRPLWYVRADDGSVYVASTRDIFKRAGFDEVPRQVPVGRMIRIQELGA